jgi:hypothetical protein
MRKWAEATPACPHHHPQGCRTSCCAGTPWVEATVVQRHPRMGSAKAGKPHSRFVCDVLSFGSESPVREHVFFLMAGNTSEHERGKNMMKIAICASFSSARRLGALLVLGALAVGGTRLPLDQQVTKELQDAPKPQTLNLSSQETRPPRAPLCDVALLLLLLHSRLAAGPGGAGSVGFRFAVTARLLFPSERERDTQSERASERARARERASASASARVSAAHSRSSRALRRPHARNSRREAATNPTSGNPIP